MVVLDSGVCLCSFCGDYWRWKGFKKHVQYCEFQTPETRLMKQNKKHRDVPTKGRRAPRQAESALTETSAASLGTE